MLRSLKHLPAAQALDAALLADYLQQALLGGDARMGHVLCGFPSAQQIPAARMPQLLGELHTLDGAYDRMVMVELLKLPRALAMVSGTLAANLVTEVMHQYSMHQKDVVCEQSNC
jgi:hypothetical protein